MARAMATGPAKGIGAVVASRALRHRFLLAAAAFGSLFAACAQSHVATDAESPILDAHVVEPVDATVGSPDASTRRDAAEPACDGAVGSPCSTDADCTVHASFSPPICLPPARGAPMGSCSSVCMVDSDCGSCGRCVANTTGTSPTPSWYGLCVRACDGGASCSAGYVCAPIDEARSGCFPDCRMQPAVCGAARCDASTGSCTLSCASDTDCSDGSRCAGGRCECGADTACGEGTCRGSGLCGCATDAACGPGHTCDPMLGCCRWGMGLCG